MTRTIIRKIKNNIESLASLYDEFKNTSLEFGLHSIFHYYLKENSNTGVVAALHQGPMMIWILIFISKICLN